MNDQFREVMGEWFRHNVADGWVELGDDNLLYVELFAQSILRLGLKPGDYIKLKVVTQQEIEEANHAV